VNGTTVLARLDSIWKMPMILDIDWNDAKIDLETT
jgi:hypothetical protein